MGSRVSEIAATLLVCQGVLYVSTPARSAEPTRVCGQRISGGFSSADFSRARSAPEVGTTRRVGARELQRQCPGGEWLRRLGGRTADVPGGPFDCGCPGGGGSTTVYRTARSPAVEKIL